MRFYSDNEEDAFDTFYNELRLFCESNMIIENRKTNINEEDFISFGLGSFHVYGYNIGLVTFKNHQYNSEFYQNYGNY